MRQARSASADPDPASGLPRCSPGVALHSSQTQLPHDRRDRRDEVERPVSWDLREMYALLMGKASAGFRIASGQTLTPLPLVSAVIDCLRPTSSDIVLDPACGTGSVLVVAHESMAQDQRRLAAGALTGVDFDASMCRFATMNYLLSTGLPFDSPPPVKGRELACREREGRSDRHRLQPAVPVDRAAARRTYGLVGEESEHAAQLPPAHRARSPDRRAGGGIRPRQHPLRGRRRTAPCACGSSRNTTCIPCCACPRAFSPTAA